MSALLYALGRRVARWRGAVLAACLLVTVAVAGVAAFASEGTRNDFTIPGTPSQQAIDALHVRFPELSGAGAQLLVTVPTGDRADAEPWRGRIAALSAEARDVKGVSAVGDSPLISDNGRSALINVQLDRTADKVTDTMRDDLRALGGKLRSDGATVTAGGDAFNINVPHLSATEALGIIVALAVLTFLFRSVVAGLLPIGSALVGALTSLSLLMIATVWTPVSSTAPMLALMIGLAVGIDYALLVLSQFREHLSSGVETEEAAGRALATSGSAVIFAGTTVVIALVALSVARIPFLTVMGLAAAAAVISAVIASLTLVPALAAMCHRWLAPTTTEGHAPHRIWFAWVDLVTRYAAVVVVLVVVVLSVIAIPARHLSLALPSNATADQGSSQRLTYDHVAAEFGPGYNAPILVTVDLISSTDPVGDVKKIAANLADVRGVDGLLLATPNRTGDLGAFVVAPDGGPSSTATRRLIERLRAEDTKITGNRNYKLSVTGQTAVQIDVSQKLADALLPFGIIVVGLSFVLLALVFRSLLMPLVAALGYALSVAAALGVTAWAFDGRPVISFLPIILMGVLFGLAMDYQVFVVSRIWEKRAVSGDVDAAVRDGFAMAAPVVVSAAVIMFAVFAAFVPEGDSTIKPIALALAAGVAFDAFLVRLVLMPAVLRLAGERAWWFPHRLGQALPVFDIEGEAVREQLAQRESGITPPAVELRGVSITSGPHIIAQDVNYAVPEGEVGLVVGPHASGKTALLLAMAGRLLPDEGEVLVHGLGVLMHPAHAHESVALAEFAGLNDLDPTLTVAEHVHERLRIRRLSPWVGRNQVLAVLDEANALVAGVVDTDLHLDPEVTVAELPPLHRRVLALTLAFVGDSSVVVVDDIDELRTSADRANYWALLEATTRLERSGHRVAVIASCQEPPGTAAAVLTLAAHPIPTGADV